MNRRGKILLIVALVAGVGAMAGYWVWPHEPSCRGRGLSAWLRDFGADQIERRAEAADAVKHIGPKAVPFLVQRLRSPNPALRRESRLEQWKRRALEWLSTHTKIKISAGRRYDPRQQALAGLDALGPAAKEALPALERLLRETPPDPRAVYVVARIGPAGLPLLTRALTNEERLVRLQGRLCLEMIKTHSELLYGEIGFGPEAAIFERRMCEFNARTLRTVFEEYRAQHPEQGLPQSVFDTPPPSPLPPEIIQSVENGGRTNRATRKRGLPASGFE
jgi:hypothetical protein